MQDIGTNEILQAISNLGINLNKRIDNIEKVVGRIPEMQKDIDDMKELVGNIPEMQKDIDDMKELVGNIPEMQKDIDDMKKLVGNIPEMQKDIDDMKELVGNIPEMQKDINSMKEGIRNLQKSVAVIEVEHGEKIKILFDAVLVNSEKIDMLNQKLDLQISKWQKHDDEIYYLKSKVQGL